MIWGSNLQDWKDAADLAANFCVMSQLNCTAAKAPSRLSAHRFPDVLDVIGEGSSLDARVGHFAAASPVKVS